MQSSRRQVSRLRFMTIRNLFDGASTLTVVCSPAVRVPRGHEVRAVYDAEELESITIGEIIAPYNDYYLRWDEVGCSSFDPAEDRIVFHLAYLTSEWSIWIALTHRWRQEGDPLCDSVVRELRIGPGQDGLQAILDHLELPTTAQLQCVRILWSQVSCDLIGHCSDDQISCEPPEEITALDENKTATPAITSCNRRPAPTVAEGQAVFWRYSSQIFSALLHFSLAGGFSADRVVGVLRETNYLTGEDRDKTYRRLLETTQAITDYMVSGANLPRLTVE